MTRAVVGESEFRTLVAGRSALLRCNDGTMIELQLSDIGWQRMVDAIIAAVIEPHRPPDPPDPPEAREFLRRRQRK